MKTFNFFIIIAFVGIISTACDSFLDQQPLDQPTTISDIFTKKINTEKYLYQCYSYIPQYWLLSAAGGYPWSAASDESEATWDHSVNNMNNGSWNPNSVPYAKWRFTYQGIRDINTFLQNVDLCKELSALQIEAYKAEVRFIRALLYSNLIRMYGPVVIVHDEIFELDKEYAIGRNPFDYCVEYVSQEFSEVSEILLTEQSTINYGKPTKGAAIALKAQLLNFAASPLFNTNNSIYAKWKSNTTGEDLMPATYNEQKWKDAAAAAKAVIDMGIYQLYKEYKQGILDPYGSIYGIHYQKWNSELIFGRHMTFGSTEAEARNFVHRITPKAFTNCWGGVSVSQKQIDAFAMNNGRYPITGYLDGSQEWDGKDGRTPIIDPASGYSETGAVNFEHPWDKVSMLTYRMYANREPRFYMGIVWDNIKLVYGNGLAKNVVINYGNGGNCYEASGTNHPLTGYTPRKFTFRESDQSLGNSGYVFPIWPIIRLAEVYLDYIEALIEYDYQNPDVLKYWNEIRERAGVPPMETVYPEMLNNQSLMRQLLRRERQVELFFENSRYFDIRRWKIAEVVNNNVPVYGMNITVADGAPNNIGQTDYWKRTPIYRGNRTFLLKHYLYPLEQREIDRNKLIEQAYGW
ncbi:membrane protein [Bacteroidia bacterium]|nr:membrane protein [Bacteroidia bacterium]